MTKAKLLPLILCASLVFTSCSAPNIIDKKNKNDNSIPTSQQIHNEGNPSSSSLSPFTGEPIDAGSFLKSPFMVVMENSKDARPQSGLKDADIVYETMAEGGIPRFIALFYKTSSQSIGPVRSLRPYFIDIAKEYDVPFIHCGGSDEALATIKENQLMSIDEITNGNYFWRDKNRKAPHNLYTSGDKITKALSIKNYPNKPKSSLQFNKDYWNNGNLENCSYLELLLNRYYKTSYTLQQGTYYKLMDDVPCVDKDTKEAVGFKNIVIQFTNITLNSDKVHVDINLKGAGDGLLLSGGKVQAIKWANESHQTCLKDLKGNAVPLSPGNTIWHIVDISTKVTKN